MEECHSKIEDIRRRKSAKIILHRRKNNLYGLFSIDNKYLIKRTKLLVWTLARIRLRISKGTRISQIYI